MTTNIQDHCEGESSPSLNTKWFGLNERQVEKLNAWKAEQDAVALKLIEENNIITYSFTPKGKDTTILVYHSYTKAVINLTES